MIWLLVNTAFAAECVVVDGGELYLPTAHKAGTVIVDGGLIAYAGDAPPGLGSATAGTIPWNGKSCIYVDARGQQVTAGVYDPHTQLGLVEVSAEGATTDSDAEEPDPIRAALRVADAYDPRASAIAVSRVGGITGGLIAPSGGLVSGIAGWAELRGATQADAVSDPQVAVMASLGATASKAEDWLALRELFAAARLYATKKSQWQNELADPPEGTSLLDLEALQPVLRREIPLVLRADRATDIEAALAFADTQNIRLILEGGAEAWLLAAELAAAKVPVIVDPQVYGAGSFDQRYGRADNAALLATAGVQVSFSTFSGHTVRELRQLAGNAVRAGLPHDDAIVAITKTPPAIYGLVDRGELSVGQLGDIVVWSGDPLEVTSLATTVVIGGEIQPLISRQTVLRDKYRKLPR